MRNVLVCLLALALLFDAATAQPLRRRLTNDKYFAHESPSLFSLQRVLQFTPPSLQDTLLNSLISYFTPQIRQTLTNTLKDKFDPLVLSNRTTQDLGEIITVGDCDTTAKIVYETEILRGLGSVQLDAMEVVPGSDDIDVSLLDGAHWNSTWVLNASFAALSASANATLYVDACGVPAMEHRLNGTATIEQPSIYMEIAVQGDTSNLILFQSTSQINQAEIQKLRFDYQMVDAKLQGNFGNMSYVNLGVELGETMYHDGSVFEVLLLEALQNGLDEQLPFRPSSY